MLDLLGQACALMAAIIWAFALVMFKRSGERVPPLALNLFKNTIGILLLVVTLAVMGEGLGTVWRWRNDEVYILLLSGVIGIAVADTVFFHSLNLIGVGVISIVDCTYSPFAILFAWWLLAEELGLWHYVGAGLILAGVLVASRVALPADRTRGQLVLGILLGASSMALMAFSIIAAKPVVEEFPLMWATLLRLLGGTLVLGLLALASPKRRALWSVFRPSPVWKVSIPASVLGAYVAMILWVAGFKYTRAALASILNQTTIIFAILLASLILKEHFTRRKLVAAILAMAGVVLVTVAPL
ncbi:MAG: DMT family transporter [Planctomycetota bacterium]